MKNKIIKLVLSVLTCQLAGIIGGIFTSQSVKTWYQTINKPDFTPPSWIFGPVWVLLYLLMGIALFLIWDLKIKTHGRGMALILFFVQLGLNTLWSFLFFYLHNPLLGLIGIIILLFFIVLTTWAFFRLNPWAGYLMIPYLLWVSFATVLNYSIWTLNP